MSKLATDNAIKRDKLVALFQKYMLEDSNDVEFLILLVNIIRPDNIVEDAKIDISVLNELLEGNEKYRAYIAKYMADIFYRKEFDQILTDSGIIKDSDFFYELRKRIVNRLLPEQPPKDTLQYVLNQVFTNNDDYYWLAGIPNDQLQKLVVLAGLDEDRNTDNYVFKFSEVIYALEVLIQRMSGAAMETSVSKMVPEYQNLDSPFIGIQREFAEFSLRLMRTPEKYTDSSDLGYKQIQILHKQCVEYVKTAFANAHKYGISIKVNQSLLRIRQQLDRIAEILPFLVIDSSEEIKSKRINLSLHLIRYNCQKSNIKKLVNESTQLISYEVTHHAARTGEHYITNSKDEYFQMLKTASGGGLVVGFLCIFKILLGNIDASAFGHAFYYSLNYAFGFIMIYLLGFTLATKQPAMTASTLIRALEFGNKDKNGRKNPDGYKNFAVFFSKVFRSQFIAFVGNVLVAFPVAFILVVLIDMVFNINIASEKWEVMITDLSPWHSSAIFHAAIAGFFLFISGIIAGSIANRDKHDHIYYRIQEHPTLKKLIGKERTQKLATLYERKWAGVASNLWFGVFMGSTASIGFFLGLNLDIRHITFASGNLALGLYGAGFTVPWQLIVWGVFGIGVIGLTNFLVSFSLSLTLALNSRNMPVRELRLVAIAIWRYFKIKPRDFFFPPVENGKG